MSSSANVCVIVLLCVSNLLLQYQLEVVCVPVAADSPPTQAAVPPENEPNDASAAAVAVTATASKVQQYSSASIINAASNNEADAKTANLIPLINETLYLNNRTVAAAPQHSSLSQAQSAPISADDKHSAAAKDEWTFDMVEYDLMDFLQDLSSRYQMLANNKSAQANLNFKNHYESHQVYGASANDQLQARHDTIPQQQQPASQPVQSVAVEPGSAAKEANQAVVDNAQPAAPAAETPTKLNKAPPPTKAPELQISLASGDDDHDISESKWQYGIFDRFTRPRASSTTTTPEPTLAPNNKGYSGYDAREFNSDECGLRTYDENVRTFLESESADQSLNGGDNRQFMDESAIGVATKELSLRRQRPPEVGSFFMSHKKHGSSANSGAAGAAASSGGAPAIVAYPSDTGEETYEASRGDHKLAPPFDKNGAATSSSQKVSTLAEDLGPESEFNLALRRQWLQQQLGNTLQMLGYANSTAAAPPPLQGSEQVVNETTLAEGVMTPAPPVREPVGVSARENMMKFSNKASKSLDDDSFMQAAPTDECAKSQSQSHGQGQPYVNTKKMALGEQVDSLKARQDELKLEARVIGGSDARLGDSPWSVSLQALVTRPGTGSMEYRHYCGGTIIGEHYILTAAHCLDFMVGRESRLFVVIGDLNWRMSTSSQYGRRFGVDKLIIHSGYKSTAFGHDIGLIRTRDSMRPLKVNGRYIINSVCLPERNVEHAGEAELVGWGLFSNRNEMADSLQIVDVPILPRPLCVDLYRRRTGLIQWLIGIELITDKQVCAGTFGRGICQGDSGSALVYNEKTTRTKPNQASLSSNQPSSVGRLQSGGRRTSRPREQESRATIVGTVAFGGIRRCSYQSLPGVYMQTSKYLDWILPRIQAG